MAIVFTCRKGHQWEPKIQRSAAETAKRVLCPKCGESVVSFAPREPEPKRNTEANTGSYQEESNDAEGMAEVDRDEQPTVAPDRTAKNRELPTVSGYEILSVLGRGGMGVVYKARQLRLKRLVALKMILAGSHAGPNDLARFRTEAEAVARLHHPNIVQIFEVGESGGLPYFSLEFVAGGSLAKLMDGTPLKPNRAAEILEQLARAMHHAHERDIIHRDLKPANVLMAVNGTPKITDFGLAKKLEGSIDQRTKSGAVMGTPSYMAPEQAEGKIDEISEATDVYALGALLYEMLTGRPPFKAETHLDTIMQVVAEEPVSPRRLQSKVPRDLEIICLKCLEKKPAKRFSSAKALAEDLQRFLNREPIQAKSLGFLGRTWKFAKKYPVFAAMVGIFILGIFLTTILAIWAINAAAKNPDDPFGFKASLPKLPTASKGIESPKFAALAHGARIWSVAISKDGRFLASAGENGSLMLWNPTSITKLRTFNGHTDVVSGVCFSGDGKQLVSGGWDRTVKTWEVDTGREIRTFSGHQRRVLCVCFSPDGKHLASGSADQTVIIWDAATGEAIHKLRGHTDDVTCVTFLSDGKHLASGSWDKTVRIWDATTGKELNTFTGHNSRITCITFGPDGNLMATAGADRAIKVWEITTGKEVNQLRKQNSEITSIAFTPDGNYLVSASWDLTVVWAYKTNQELTPIWGQKDVVTNLVIFPDGKRAASGSWDKTIKIWELFPTRRLQNNDQ